MNKLTELIKLEDLAAEYQKKIGNRFTIELNANTNIDGARENAIMLATRQPYKISNIKAESLQIVLHFYTCCEYKEDYDNTIQILSQLCGLVKGTFASNDKTYRYFSFLDFTRPLSEPVVDTGKFYQTLELMGTCLVTQTEGGVLVGNEVETKFKLDIGKPTEMEETIEVLAANTTLTKTQEAPQMSNQTVAKAFNNAQAYTYSYTILMLKNKVCERLLKAIKNIEPFGLNEELQIIESYPSFTGVNIEDKKSVVVTGASLDRQAGAFVSFTITFQDRLELVGIDYDDEDGDIDDPDTGDEAQGEYLVGNPFSASNCAVRITFRTERNGTIYTLPSEYISNSYDLASAVEPGYVGEGVVSPDAMFGTLSTGAACGVYEDVDDDVFDITFLKPILWTNQCVLILHGAQEVGDGVYLQDINGNTYAPLENESVAFPDHKEYNIPEGTLISRLLVDGALFGFDSLIRLSLG